MGGPVKHDTGDLIGRCLQHDRQAQEELYRAHAQRLYHIALQYTGDRDEAKDVLQDSFVKIFQSLQKYTGKGALEGWMNRIVANTAIDYLRKHSKMRMVEAKEQLPDIGEEEEETPIRLPMDKMLSLIKQLPEQARIIFNLYVMDNLNHRQIAEKLSISEGTSKSQYSRARGLLKKWISQTSG